eukprot:1742212-Prymnesium_polylepis.1
MSAQPPHSSGHPNDVRLATFTQVVSGHRNEGHAPPGDDLEHLEPSQKAKIVKLARDYVIHQPC